MISFKKNQSLDEESTWEKKQLSIQKRGIIQFDAVPHFLPQPHKYFFIASFVVERIQENILPKKHQKRKKIQEIFAVTQQ